MSVERIPEELLIHEIKLFKFIKQSSDWKGQIEYSEEIILKARCESSSAKFTTINGDLKQANLFVMLNAEEGLNIDVADKIEFNGISYEVIQAGIMPTMESNHWEVYLEAK